MLINIYVVGLGNSGNEYEHTRHNVGRDIVKLLAKKEKMKEFSLNKTAKALVTKGSICGKSVTVVLPETMMNLSGKTVCKFITSARAAKTLLVVHDDLDLPLGTIKMVFSRGSGGHKGVESIMRAIKTTEFARLRIGISSIGKKNQAKKLKDEDKVIKHVLGKWKSSETATLKKVLKKATEATRLFVTDGLESATQFANTN